MGFFSGFEKRAAASSFLKLSWDLNTARKATSGIKGLVRRSLGETSGGLGFVGNKMRRNFGPMTIAHPVPKTLPKMRQAVEEQAPALMRVKPGTIAAKGDLTKNPAFRSSGLVPREGLSGQDKEMLNRTMLSHEMSERKYIRKKGKNDTEIFNTHKDPRVIIEESNALATMPKEHAKVKGIVSGARDMDDTKDILESGVKGFQYGETRMSRHAKKRMYDVLKRKGHIQNLKDIEKEM